MSTQWAAQFLVAGELERAGYVVTFTMGHATPFADLMVGRLDKGCQFWVDVKGLRTRNSWWGEEKVLRERLFYVGVHVAKVRADDEFFVMSQVEWNDLIRDYNARHPKQKKSGGFAWKDALPHKDRWDKLPCWPHPD